MLSSDLLLAVGKAQHQDRLREAAAHRLLQDHLEPRPTVWQSVSTLWSKIGNRNEAKEQRMIEVKVVEGLS